MNGNLSQRKGLLSEITDEHLVAIAEMLYTWSGLQEADITKKEDVENKLTREQFLETCEILTDEEMDRLYVSALIIRELAARLETAESKADYALTEKADKADTFTIKEMEEKLSDKADKVDSYTKEEVTDKLSEKEDIINKTNTISDTPSKDKYPSEVAVFERFMLWDSSIKEYVHTMLDSNYYDKTAIDSIGSDVFVVHGFCGFDEDDNFVVGGFDCDEIEIIKQHNAGKLVVLKMEYRSWYVLGSLQEISEKNGYLVFVVNNGAELNHRVINDMGIWRAEKIQDNGETEIPEISVEDLDNLTTTGIYKALSDGKFVIYIVSGHYNLVMQTLFSGEEITSRKLTADGWSEWDRVAMNSTFELAVQEVVSLLANKEDISNKLLSQREYAAGETNPPYFSAEASQEYTNGAVSSAFDTLTIMFDDKLQGYATKEELNNSIKSAILDSWEAAV